MEKQRAILESVIKEEIDFISYVDLEDGMVHTIVTNEDADVMPPIDGDYQKVNDVTIPKYVHPEDREMCEREFRLERLQENLQKKERFVINYRLLCGGEYRRKSMNIHYYDKTKMTLVFVRRDVTDNYEEEQNRQREIYDAMLAAKRADRSKSEFLERMSHEIRTPLNSIIGLSYLSRANLGDEKKVLENFDKIEMSAQFLRSCMDDILNLSLLESGRVAFHEESTDFEAFLTHIEKEFSDKAQEKKISFSVQRRGSFADQYLFDREKLNEALSAILENAVKYTQPEGSVFFIIELFTRGEQETIFRFEIRDNGIGMEQNFLPHIFDAFAQEDDRIAEALSVAEHSDVVVLCIGLDESLEGEEGDTGNAYASGDKENLEFPKSQQRLMHAVLETGKKVIVCNFTGSAMNLSEAEEKAEAVIQAWYPGSQGGKALANILFGEVSPSGKLPITFYRTLDELPDFTDYSMKGRTYRYLTEEPLYPFGYGLSYGDVQVEKAEFAKAPEKEQDAEICVTVKNYSEVATRDVVEVYIKNQDSKYAPVNPALCGFAKVSLGAGEEKELTITVSKEAYKVVNDEGEKIFDSSSSVLFVGTNGPDKRSEALTGKMTKQLVINW